MDSINRSANVVWEGTIARGTGYVSGGSGALAAAFERAVREAEQSCPVSRALAGNVEIRTRSRLEQMV